jgi:hypothetical protein
MSRDLELPLPDGFDLERVERLRQADQKIRATKRLLRSCAAQADSVTPRRLADIADQVGIPRQDARRIATSIIPVREKNLDDACTKILAYPLDDEPLIPPAPRHCHTGHHRGDPPHSHHRSAPSHRHRTWTGCASSSPTATTPTPPSTSPASPRPNADSSGNHHHEPILLGHPAPR